MLVKGLVKSMGVSDPVASAIDIAVTGFTAFKAVELIVGLFSSSDDRGPAPRVYNPEPMHTPTPQEEAAAEARLARRDARDEADRQYRCSYMPWAAECQSSISVDEGKGFKIDEAALESFDEKTPMKDATSSQAAIFSSAHAALTDAIATNGLVPLDPKDNNGWTGVTHDENGTPIYTNAQGDIAVGNGDSATVYNSNGDVTREGKKEVASSAPTTVIISSLI